MLFNLQALTSVLFLSATVFCVAVGTAEHLEISPHPKGIDVSSHRGNVDWDAIVDNGISFAYIKATEGISEYTGAADADLIRGSYHFALPDRSSGAAQANWFASHGGGCCDGITLPGALDLECNLYDDTCYALSATEMVSWIRDFPNTYHSRVDRYPVIYTATNWWRACTEGGPAFASHSPSWLAHYARSIGNLPNGWSYHTFWQYADSGPVPGDQNYFNGDMTGLKRLALS